MPRALYIFLLVAGVLILAAGGWTVRAVRWAVNVPGKPDAIPAT